MTRRRRLAARPRDFPRPPENSAKLLGARRMVGDAARSMPLPDLLPITPFTRPVRGVVTLPGSKSLTNRALLLAALCTRPVTLTGALFSEDTHLMAEALRRLGFTIEADAAALTIRVAGQAGGFGVAAGVAVPTARAMVRVVPAAAGGFGVAFRIAEPAALAAVAAAVVVIVVASAPAVALGAVAATAAIIVVAYEAAALVALGSVVPRHVVGLLG